MCYCRIEKWFREELLLQEIEAKELHEKLRDPEFVEQAQLIDVREPDEVYAIFSSTHFLDAFMLVILLSSIFYCGK